LFKFHCILPLFVDQNGREIGQRLVVADLIEMTPALLAGSVASDIISAHPADRLAPAAL
jgi:hypothetical protein